MFRVVVLLPTVTDTLAFPGGIPMGMRALIWKAPVGSVGAAPAYWISATCPLIMTVTGALVFG